MSKIQYRNRSDIFGLQPLEYNNPTAKKEQYSEQLASFQNDQDLRQKRKEQAKQFERNMMHKKLSEMAQEDLMNKQDKFKRKHMAQMMMQRDLDEVRKRKEFLKMRQKEDDRKYVKQEEAYFEKRDNERNSLFNKIRQKGNNKNMRVGFTNNPAGPRIEKKPVESAEYQQGPGMIFGERQEETRAMKIAKHSTYLEELRVQAEQRKKFIEMEKKMSKRQVKDSLDAELNSEKQVHERQKHIDMMKRKQYKQYLEDQINERNIYKQKEKSMKNENSFKNTGMGNIGYISSIPKEKPTGTKHVYKGDPIMAEIYGENKNMQMEKLKESYRQIPPVQKQEYQALPPQPAPINAPVKVEEPFNIPVRGPDYKHYENPSFPQYMRDRNLPADIETIQRIQQAYGQGPNAPGAGNDGVDMNLQNISSQVQNQAVLDARKKYQMFKAKNAKSSYNILTGM